MTKRSTRRQRREIEKLLGTGASAIVIGLMFILAPAFVTTPAFKAAFAGLRSTGWYAIAAGVVLLVIAGLMRRSEAGKEPSADSTTSSARRGRQAPRPAQGVPPCSADVSVPETPGVWSAAVFDVIEWRRFEALCEWLFRQDGFETKTQSHGADGGVDIWLYRMGYSGEPERVVQCKHWSTRPVKVAEVRALLGSMAHSKVSRGVFATTSNFTSDARQFAKANNIELIDRAGLLELILSRTQEQQRELLAVATKGEFWVPTCPSCGIKMTRRAKKNGGGFWGCVNFPRCMTAING